MTRSERPARLRVLAAILAVAMIAGGLAGLADALVSAGRTASAPLLLLAASTGAALGLVGMLPVAVVLAWSGRPRSLGGKLAIAVTLLLSVPVDVAIGRHLYRSIPWETGEWLLAVAAGLALVAVCAPAAWTGSRLATGTAAVRLLSRAFFPALLLAAPASVRVGGALGPPRASVSGTANGSNLLLLTIDTLRPDALGSTGSPTARTPWLDRMARRSVTFSECFAPSPWTLPSLGTVLTGSYPGEHLVLEGLSGISPSVTTIAETCRENGRRTAAFVSNPWLSAGGLARGFDVFDVAERLECLREIRSTRIYSALARTLLRLRRMDGGDRISARGRAWITGGEGTWFLWLHYFDPHLPNWPRVPFDRLFGPPPVHAHYSMEVEDIRAGNYSGGEETRREIARLYDGEVAFADRAVGDVWRALEEHGDLDHTAVVLAADHGEEFWDHAGYGHGHTMFDEVVHVPFFVRPAGGTTGRVVSRLAALVDLAPTALAAAGLTVPEGTFRGANLLSGTAERTATYGEATLYGPEQKFLRTDRWKLVYEAGDGGAPGRLRLFDVAVDPAERRDLAAERPALVDSLLAELGAWREAVGSSGAMAARDLPRDLDAATRAQLEALGYVR